MSSIGTAVSPSHLGLDLDLHLAMCRGETCAACQRYLPARDKSIRGMRLCVLCWPDASVPWTALHAALQWSPSDGWVMCICYPTPEQTGPPVSCWILLHDRAECIAILKRYLCRKSDLIRLQQETSNAGHATVAFFVGPRRLAALVQATRRDPRTAYDKLKALGRR